MPLISSLYSRSNYSTKNYLRSCGRIASSCVFHAAENKRWLVSSYHFHWQVNNHAGNQYHAVLLQDAHTPIRFYSHVMLLQECLSHLSSHPFSVRRCRQ